MAKPDQEAIERLRGWIKPGDTLYTSVKHVSRSGMMRSIAVYKFEDNEPLWLSYNVAKALGNTFDREREGVKIGGCGMDMGFALVYDLSYTLFKDGFACVGEGCPANDHSNGVERPVGACTGDDCTNPGIRLCERHSEVRASFRASELHEHLILHGLTVDPEKRPGQCVPWMHSDPGYALKQRWL